MIEPKIKYILAGTWNTLFGYTVGLTLYSYIPNVIVVGLLGNILSISMSFLSYKLFVFKTKGNWISEYLKCFIVYGMSAVLGTLGLIILVDLLKIKFWISQIIIITINFGITFIAHRNFTFGR